MKLSPKLKEKNWNPQLELKILNLWKKEKVYSFNPKSKKPIFSIDTPPPYPSGTFHIAQAAHYSQIDAYCKNC
jgi:valyl-tRNA synthetase